VNEALARSIVAQMKPRSVPAPALLAPQASHRALPDGIVKRASGHYAVGRKLFRTIEDASAWLREQAEVNPPTLGD
jgi:hypothetical protein